MQLNSPVKILDVTLRDGGHVNNFAFGRDHIRSIVDCLSRARIDVIELGFLKNVTYHPDKSLFSTVAQAEALLDGLPLKQDYSLMIRPDWYDIAQLETRKGRIGKIRWAFHERDLELSIRQARQARALGYEIYFNPVNVFSYSEGSLRNVLQAINELEPSYVAIVDTHGSMVEQDLLHYFAVFDESLKPKIGLSVHLHENLSLSFSLAQRFIALAEGKRHVSVDASILGMGRIPGNLCTELLARYVNMYRGGQYNISAIYEAIQDSVCEIKQKLPWGYAPLYAESAFRRVHRSYAEYLIENTELSVSESSSVLALIQSHEDREEFNRNLVENLVASLQNTSLKMT
jgi:4-hydroxy 2-oxovalerate aldolase